MQYSQYSNAIQLIIAWNLCTLLNDFLVLGVIQQCKLAGA